MRGETQEDRGDRERGNSVELWTCAACGDRIDQHVSGAERRAREALGVLFCPTCDERARTPIEDDELGGGD